MSESAMLDAPARDTDPEDKALGPISEPIATVNKRTDYETLNYGVDPERIDGRTGNFLFTVGNPSSGKSTLQSYLIYRLWSHPKVTFDYANAYGENEHDVILNAWVQNFANGYLPKRTLQGLIQEFNVSYGQPRKPSVAFNFVEISGEDIRSIVPTAEGNVPQLHPCLEQYLRLPKARKRFLFVSDASSNRISSSANGRALEEDVLFDHLIRYLLSGSGANLKHLDVLFAATKWDVVKSEYRSEREYFDTNFPQTQSTLKHSRAMFWCGQNG